MPNRSNNVKEIHDLQDNAKRESIVEKKLNELISLISKSEFDNKTIKQFQQKFNQAVEKKGDKTEMIEAFKIIDTKDNETRSELLDEFSMLLLSNKIDSKIAHNYLKGERANRFVLKLIGLTMVTLGFAMIIMPAPPFFEMFTIFYFSQDDGVTLMDLISLAIVFSGIYLFVRTFYKKPMRRSNYD